MNPGLEPEGIVWSLALVLYWLHSNGTHLMKWREADDPHVILSNVIQYSAEPLAVEDRLQWTRLPPLFKRLVRSGLRVDKLTRPSLTQASPTVRQTMLRNNITN
jgi:hypothetical protein